MTKSYCQQFDLSCIEDTRTNDTKQIFMLKF